MKFRRNKNSTEENYWQPATDMMAGLLLVILLIMALLLLYIGHNQFEYEHNGEEGSTQPSVAISSEEQTTENQIIQNGGGETETTEPYTHTIEDEEGKAAVLVKVVDSDTGNTIKKEGVLFELYSGNGSQTLSTYYPEKVDYKQYQTRGDGTFFLPEKIFEEAYSLHNIKAPEEYHTGKNVDFHIDRAYDWYEPFIVEFPLTPVKNAITISCKDKRTKDPVSDGVFKVYADEDIKTLDGTVRFKNGSLVDTITCNSQGVGKSKELNLGKYYVVQTSVKNHYSLYDKTINVEIENEKDKEADATEVLCSKTSFRFNLTDKYTDEPISDAVFTISGKGDLKTNTDGKISVENLDKNTSYECKLKKLPNGYKSSMDTITFEVDENGNIKGKSTYSVSETAYMIRLKVLVKDSIIGYNLNGESITLYDENDKVTFNWDCDGSARVFDDIKPGKYKVFVNNVDTGTVATVEENVELNEKVVYVWTLADTMIVVIVALVTLSLIVLLIKLIFKRKNKKKRLV